MRLLQIVRYRNAAAASQDSLFPNSANYDVRQSFKRSFTGSLKRSRKLSCAASLQKRLLPGPLCLALNSACLCSSRQGSFLIAVRCGSISISQLSGRLSPGSFGSLLGLVLTHVMEHIPQEVIYKLSDVATSAAAAREASSWVLLQLADALADAGVDVTRLSELAQEVRLRAVSCSARVYLLFTACASSVFVSVHHRVRECVCWQLV